MAEFGGPSASASASTRTVLARQPGYIRSLEISKKNMSYNKLMSQINEQTKPPLVIPAPMFGFKWGERTSDPIPMLSVIAGKSGVGKSTLLNLIRYYFNDKDTSKLPFKIELNDPEAATDSALEQLDETCIDLLKVNGNVNLKDPLRLGNMLHNRFARNKEVNLNCDLFGESSCLTGGDDPTSKLNFVQHGRIKHLFAGKENQENKLKMNERLKKKKFKFYLESDADNDNELVFKRLNNPNSSLKLKNLSVKEQLTFFAELIKLNLKSNSSSSGSDQTTAGQVQDGGGGGDQSIKFMNLGKILSMIKVNLNADLVTINKQLEAKGFRYLIDLDSYKEIVFTQKSSSSSGKKKNSTADPKKYKLADLAASEQLVFFEKMAKLFDTTSSKKSSSDSAAFSNESTLNLLESESVKAKFLGTDGAKNVQKLNDKLRKEKKFPYEMAFEKQVEFVARLRNKPDTKLKLASLSSTEQLILLSHLWELNRFQFVNHFNKLVLLIDDADLNMHPKELSDFIRLVIDVLVNQMKIQVILNTNHPTVVSYLVKENLNSSCLFEMYEEEDEIKIARDHESSEDMSTIDHYLNKIGIFMPSNYEHLLASSSSPSPYLLTTASSQNPTQPLSSIVEENVYPEAAALMTKEDQELMYDSVYATINDKNMSIDTTSQSATPHQSASTTPVQRLSQSHELPAAKEQMASSPRSFQFKSADIFIRTAVNTAKRRLVEANQNHEAATHDENNYEMDNSSVDEYDKSQQHHLSSSMAAAGGFSRTSKRNRSDLHPLVPIYNILAERNILENKKTLEYYQSKHNKLFDIES